MYLATLVLLFILASFVLSQVVIAGLYTNCEVMLSVLESASVPSATNCSLSDSFIKQWIEDVDCFLGLHDRKLCVLGLCTLLQLGPDRVPALKFCHSQILPAMLVLFQGKLILQTSFIIIIIIIMVQHQVSLIYSECDTTDSKIHRMRLFIT